MTARNLYTVAVVLVLERRVCSCGHEFDCPSPVIHELATSHEKADFTQVLTVYPKDAPDMAEQKSLRVILIPIHACHFCWKINAQWDDVAAYRPPAPKEQPRGTMAAQLAGLKIFREPTLDEL